MNSNIRPFKPKYRKPTKFDVYFDADGRLSWHHAQWSNPAHKEPNEVFTDKLVYSGYSNSRGGVHIFFISEKTGRELSMFMSDFDEIIKAGLFMDKTVQGKFCFTKKGQSQGVRYFFEP